MGLAGEPEQNPWKEMSCRQSIENVRLSGTKLNLQINKTYYLPLRHRSWERRQGKSVAGEQWSMGKFTQVSQSGRGWCGRNIDHVVFSARGLASNDAL